MQYQILWVEDRPDWFGPMSESIGEYLTELGFEPVIPLCSDWEGVAKHLASQNVDLIAVDYNLKGIKGDEIVENIRENENFIEILFYTADENWRETLPPHDGVYRASRNDVEDKMRRLIALTLKRVQSPANMRGVVIAETTDLEALIEEILVAHFGEKGKVFQDRVLREEGFTFGKKYQLLMGLLGDRIKVCNVALNSGGKKDEATADLLARLKPLHETLGEFDKTVIWTRNVLAHTRLCLLIL